MHIRPIRETDIDGLIALFRSAYGEAYALPEVYDPEALKRGIYSDNIHWLVGEDGGEILGSGACVMGMGDYNDQIGEIGRLVVKPGSRSKGLARELVAALVTATGERVEFAFAESRTVHPYSQKMAENVGMATLGFMPMAYQMEQRESFVFNGQLLGNGRALRAPGLARAIPAVAPLARLSLRNLGLDEPVQEEPAASGYPVDASLSISALDSGSLLRLLRIEHGRVLEPEVFGGLHVDQGLSQIRARRMHYFVAAGGGRTLGAVGYCVEEHDQNVRITELIGEEAATKGALLRFAVDRAEQVHAARLVQCDASAESPAIQQTLLELGFLPAAYVPGMVFHGTRRLDVVRFLKLDGEWSPGPMTLLEPAREYHDLVVPAFERALAARGRGREWRRASLASGFTPSDHEILRLLGEESAPAPGMALDPAAVHIVLDGVVRRGGHRIGPGDCANAAALFGARAAVAAVAGENCWLLTLAPPSLSRLVERYPRLALKLARSLATAPE